MGCSASRLPEYKVVLLGLDGAGNTALLYRMRLGQVVSTVPTIGFNVETLRYKSVSVTFWDIGGQARIRPLWRHYINKGVGAILFVIDCADHERKQEAKEEFEQLLLKEELQGVPFVIIANKQDLKGAMKKNDVCQFLGTNNIHDRLIEVIETSAMTGDGLDTCLKVTASMHHRRK